MPDLSDLFTFEHAWMVICAVLVLGGLAVVGHVRYRRTLGEHVFCEYAAAGCCIAPGVIALIVRRGSRIPFGGDLLLAYCPEHVRCAPAQGAGGVYSYAWRGRPGPMLVGEAWDVLAVEQPGCCRCGGQLGPAEVLVWGPGDGVQGFESYCRADGVGRRFFEGCTFAVVAPAYTIAEERERAVEAFGQREPVTPLGG